MLPLKNEKPFISDTVTHKKLQVVNVGNDFQMVYTFLANKISRLLQKACILYVIMLHTPLLIPFRIVRDFYYGLKKEQQNTFQCFVRKTFSTVCVNLISVWGLLLGGFHFSEWKTILHRNFPPILLCLTISLLSYRFQGSLEKAPISAFSEKMFRSRNQKLFSEITCVDHFREPM